MEHSAIEGQVAEDEEVVAIDAGAPQLDRAVGIDLGDVVEADVGALDASELGIEHDVLAIEEGRRGEVLGGGHQEAVAIMHHVGAILALQGHGEGLAPRLALSRGRRGLGGDGELGCQQHGREQAAGGHPGLR